MNEIFLGIDTSCYTTSAACVCVNNLISDMRLPLPVGLGERGLRQSEALFQHVRNLDSIIPELFREIRSSDVAAIGISTCPSSREDSYMPVFLAGKSHARAIASALGVKVFEYTHQQGHIRAALKDNEQLMGKRFFAFHLSGGTCELLIVEGDFSITNVGGTTDITAGQLVDRLGVRMGLSFPAGSALEVLARDYSNETICADGNVMLPSSVKGLNCSFSGVETKAAKLIDESANKHAVAYAIYDCIARTLEKLIRNARVEYQINDFLLAGGVASSALLRTMLNKRTDGIGVKLHFSQPRLASDNAVGIALLCMDEYNRTQRGHK